MQRKLLPRLLEGAFRLLGAGLLGAIGGKDLVEASGHLEIHLSWPSEEVSPQPPDPGARPLFHLLAAAVMAGHLLLQKQILREWSRGAAPLDSLPSGPGGYREAVPEGELLSGETRGLFLVRISPEGDPTKPHAVLRESAEDLEELLDILVSMRTVEACLSVMRAEPALRARIEELGPKLSEKLDVRELHAWISRLTAEVR